MPICHGSHQSHPPALRLQFWGPPGPLLGRGALAPSRERAPGTRQRQPQVRGRAGGAGARGVGDAPAHARGASGLWRPSGEGGGCRFGWLSKCTAPRTPEILIGLVWYGGLRSLHCNEHPSPGCCWFWRLLDQTWRNLDLGFGQSLRSSSFGLVDASFARHCVRRAGVPSPGG